MTGSALGHRQARALPWTRKRAGGPFDPVTLLFSATELAV
jgi:hypothetical protein